MPRNSSHTVMPGFDGTNLRCLCGWEPNYGALLELKDQDAAIQRHIEAAKVVLDYLARRRADVFLREVGE